MKITTEVPEPLPITWTLQIDDDEMAVIVDHLSRARVDGITNRLRCRMEAQIGRSAIVRLRERGAFLRGDPDAQQPGEVRGPGF